MESRIKLVAGVALLAASLMLAVSSLTTAPDDPAKPTPAKAVVDAQAHDPAMRLVAAGPIGRGERITAEMLRPLAISGHAASGTLSDPKNAIGAIALEDIRAGQFILSSALMRDPEARPGLSVLVPPGLRAVAIRVNDEVAVGNFLRADDRIDLQLVLPSDQVARLRGLPVADGEPPESHVLLEGVQVLSAGESLTVTQGETAIRMQNITVAVTPEQALLIAVAKQVGTFYLSLRNPRDPGHSDAPYLSARRLIGNDEPEEAGKTDKPKPRRVQMILGGATTYQEVPAEQ